VSPQPLGQAGLPAALESHRPDRARRAARARCGAASTSCTTRCCRCRARRRAARSSGRCALRSWARRASTRAACRRRAPYPHAPRLVRPVWLPLPALHSCDGVRRGQEAVRHMRSPCVDASRVRPARHGLWFAKLERRACVAVPQGGTRPQRAQLLGPSPAGLRRTSSLLYPNPNRNPDAGVLPARLPRALRRQLRHVCRRGWRQPRALAARVRH
jgi:hypothetical protein